jgi:hypothetical protein
MENNSNQGSGNGSSRDRNNPDITAIIDEVIARVKRILNDFELVVEEAFTFFDMLRNLFQEIRDLFTLKNEQGSRAQMEIA